MKKQIKILPGIMGSTFTLIELVLVLGLVSLGFIGVTTMTSIGIDVGRDVVAKGITTDAAEQFLRLNSIRIREDWSWLDIFPDARPEYDDSVLSDRTVWGWSDNVFLENDSAKIRFVTQDRNAVFSASAPNHQTGFFLVEQQSPKYQRFRVSIRCWKKIESKGNGSEEAVLFVEASCPAEKPYRERQKQMFRLEVFKATQVALNSAPPTTEAYDESQN